MAAVLFPLDQVTRLDSAFKSLVDLEFYIRLFRHLGPPLWLRDETIGSLGHHSAQISRDSARQERVILASRYRGQIPLWVRVFNGVISRVRGL